MQTILFTIFCCVSCYEVRAQNPNPVATLTLIPPPRYNWEEFATSHPALNEATKDKDNFTCVLSLLNTALSEELENSQLQISEESQDLALSYVNSTLEEEQLNKETEEDPQKQAEINKNETDAEKALYQKIITKIASAFPKPQNVTYNQNNIETPSMIPIFKPRQTMPSNELKQNIIPDFNPAPVPVTRQTPKSRAISFVPEKIIQTSMNPFPRQSMFNIPCQRAADVLDMTKNVVPKESVCGITNVKPNVNPNVEPNANSIMEEPKPKFGSQITPPVTLSVSCADSDDDTVAMLFKPRNISLMQVYGNLMKKITMTVLVPYHMSKLSAK